MLVTILLNRNALAMLPGRSLDPSDTFEEAFSFDVEDADPMALCEVAFTVCNSYIGEMHCDVAYTKEVRQYRWAGKRSLSVGDVVKVDEEFFFCATLGFEKLDAPVTITANV